MNPRRWNLTSETKLGRVYLQLCKDWTSVRHVERRDVLTFCQRVSELRRKVGPALGFEVEDRWEPKHRTPVGGERVKEHRIVPLAQKVSSGETGTGGAGGGGGDEASSSGGGGRWAARQRLGGRRTVQLTLLALILGASLAAAADHLMVGVAPGVTFALVVDGELVDVAESSPGGLLLLAAPDCAAPPCAAELEVPSGHVIEGGGCQFRERR